jgi:hypothetical protein
LCGARNAQLGASWGLYPDLRWSTQYRYSSSSTLLRTEDRMTANKCQGTPYIQSNTAQSTWNNNLRSMENGHGKLAPPRILPWPQPVGQQTPTKTNQNQPNRPMPHPLNLSVARFSGPRTTKNISNLSQSSLSFLIVLPSRKLLAWQLYSFSGTLHIVPLVNHVYTVF